MKPTSRTVVVVLSAAFCGAAVVSTTNNLLTPPSPSSVGEPIKALSPAPLGPPRPASSAVSTRLTAPDTADRTAATSPVLVAADQHTYRDGSYTGPAMDAYYGLLRVRVDVQGGRITAIHVLEYPSDNRTSRFINSQALPMLESEVIQKQSVFVYMVSGATLSSNAFLRSTSFALRQAQA